MFRQFTVTKALIGYHAQIGCQQVCVSEDRKDELKRLICDYIDKPEEMEKKYYSTGDQAVAPSRLNPDPTPTLRPTAERQATVGETIGRIR